LDAFDIARKHCIGGAGDRATARERKECRAVFKNCAAPMAVIKNFIPMRAARAGCLNRSGTNVFSRAVGAPTRYATP
jgi:hypothetical protein